MENLLTSYNYEGIFPPLKNTEKQLNKKTRTSQVNNYKSR